MRISFTIRSFSLYSLLLFLIYGFELKLTCYTSSRDHHNNNQPDEGRANHETYFINFIGHFQKEFYSFFLEINV